MFFRDVIPILILSWVGAAIISFAVYEWRQDNDLDDLREQIDNLQDGIGLGDDSDAIGFDPNSVQAGDALLTIRSSSIAAPATEGAVPAGGSLVLAIENVGSGVVIANPLSVSATTVSGTACQPTVAYYADSLAELATAQETEVEISWPCPDLATLTVLGAAEFTVSTED